MILRCNYCKMMVDSQDLIIQHFIRCFLSSHFSNLYMLGNGRCISIQLRETRNIYKINIQKDSNNLRYDVYENDMAIFGNSRDLNVILHEIVALNT